MKQGVVTTDTTGGPEGWATDSAGFPPLSQRHNLMCVLAHMYTRAGTSTGRFEVGPVVTAHRSEAGEQSPIWNPGTTPPAPQGAAGGPAAELARPLSPPAGRLADRPRELASGAVTPSAGPLSRHPGAIASRCPAGSRPDSGSVTGPRLSRRIGLSGSRFRPASARMAHGGTLRRSVLALEVALPPASQSVEVAS